MLDDYSCVQQARRTTSLFATAEEDATEAGAGRVRCCSAAIHLLCPAAGDFLGDMDADGDEETAVLALRYQLRELGVDDSPFSKRQLTDLLLGEDAQPPECPICLEPVLPRDRFTASQCGHVFHKDPCMLAYFEAVATDSPQFPLRCPDCRKELDPQSCLSVFQGTEQAFHKLQNLILERQHHAHLRYCSNVRCAQPFDWFDDPSLHRFDDRFKVTCPLCTHMTCAQCRGEWHEGKPCKNVEQVGDGTDAFRQLAVENGWQPCPRCGQAIDRQKGDCNFVRCRCGCGFCHSCGKEYQSLTGTAANLHGKPDCRCKLFGEGNAVVNIGQLGAQDEAVQPRPQPAAVHVQEGEEFGCRCQIC